MRISFAAAQAASFAFGWPVARYICFQRNCLIGSARPLSRAERDELTPYFAEIDLNRVRLAIGGRLPLPNAHLPAMARRLGWHIPAPALVAGVTLDDVIALCEPPGRSLLFHEMVHVTQYRLLGINGFSSLYVRGFLATGSYDAIPLERCAFDLEYRYLTSQRSFSVDEEIADKIGRGAL